MIPKSEEHLCYLYSITDDEYYFLVIFEDKHYIQYRMSNRNDFMHIPCENIPINTLFLYQIIVEPSIMQTKCIEAPIERYLKIVSDRKMIDALKRKEIEEDGLLNTIEDNLHNKIKQMRNDMIESILL